MAIKDDVFNSIVAMRPNTTSGRRLARLRGIDSQVSDNNQANLVETEHKLNTQPNTNPTQTEHKLDTKLNTNQTQQFKNLTQSEHKPNTQPNTQPNTNPTQTEHKLDTKLNTTRSVSMLTGLQRDILFLIYNECQNSRSKITEPLTLEYIANALNIKVGSIKTTIQRLINKSFLSRSEFKNGRGGWAKYELPDNTYREMLQLETEHKLYTNYTQTRHKLNTQPNTQPDTSPPNNNNNLNIYKNIIISELPDEWKKIDIEPLQQIHFSISHIKEIYEQNVTTPEIVQTSIYHFAYTLEHKLESLKKYPNKVAALMSRLKKGYAWTESSYESPQEIAMREYLEAKKAELEKIEKIEKELLEVQLTAWITTLTSEQIKSLAPSFKPDGRGVESAITRSELREHFKQQEWPKIKASILNNQKKGGEPGKFNIER